MTAPAHRVPDMPWAGWGRPDRQVRLPDAVAALLAQALGIRPDQPTPPGPSLPARPDGQLGPTGQLGPAGQPEPAGAAGAAEPGVRLAEPALPAAAATALAAVVGAQHVRTDRTARLLHSGGKSTIDLLRRRRGQANPADPATLAAPDAVLLPASHDEVMAVLRCCAEHRVAVVPFGGGTSVVGGVEPVRGGLAAVVALDLRRLDQLLAVDPTSATATLQPGLKAPEAEELLAAHGLTIGHYPQSFEHATIGGFAATRSSGQASAGYGRFDELVTALRVATPAGELRLGRAPASAAGPDLRALLLGSEGVFGVITEVTVRVRPIPPTHLDEGWAFPDFAAGAAALRRLAQAGALPTIARLSDEAETAVNRALTAALPAAARRTDSAAGPADLAARPAGAAAGSAGSGGGSADHPSGPGRPPAAVVGAALMITAYEGEPAAVAARREAAAGILVAAGGSPLGPAGAAGWRAGRFAAPYLRDGLLDAGALVETLETAASWSALPGLYAAVRSAVTAALAEPGRAPLVLCHISHVYPTGASLYFTVVAAAGADPIARWQRAKQAAGDAIAAHGATITHHHAVGTDHRRWLPAEVGELGVAVLRAVKRVLDPAGILNPGKLLPGEQPAAAAPPVGRSPAPDAPDSPGSGG
jgi:alkyldihydroxyacetonephosphate synthase